MAGKAFWKESRRRSVKQLLIAGCFVALSLLLVGLCTNTIVLPFVNLSAALERASASASPKLAQPKAADPTSSLSFIELLRRFYSGVPEGKVPDTGLYDSSETELYICAIDPAILPAAQIENGKSALRARMGFLVRQNADGTQSLLNASGNAILETMPDTLDFTGHWDASGRAVFSQNGAFSVYDTESGEFVPSDYQKELSNITGVDLPAYYDLPDGDIALYYSEGKYGFYYQSTMAPCYQFYHRGQSYQFREGFGALGTADGVLVVDRSATSFFNLYGTLLQPVGEGEDLIGYYRCEHGLMRVCVSDGADGREDLILTSANRRFYLPADYRLISYSDGVFLLEKDGRYGYLDYTGRWIAQPTFSFAEPFKEGLGVVRDQNGLYGAVDRAGLFVIPCECSELSVSGGVIALRRAGAWTVLWKV